MHSTVGWWLAAMLGPESVGQAFTGADMTSMLGNAVVSAVIGAILGLVGGFIGKLTSRGR